MFQIGVAAQRSGLSIDTIRFYEKRGLIKPAGRTARGYRLFSDQDLVVLKLVVKSHALGFSLNEIGQLLNFRRQPACTCMNVRKMIENKLCQIRKSIEQLCTLELELAQDLEQCNQVLQTKSAQPSNCPVLERLGASSSASQNQRL